MREKGHWVSYLRQRPGPLVVRTAHGLEESPGPFGSCLCLESGWKESEERLVQAGFPKASEGSGGDLGG